MVSDGTGGFPEGVEVKEIKVGKQERNAADTAKIEAIKQFLDIIPTEEVDMFFLENMNLAVTLGYRLQAEPRILLTQIEKAAA
jgi:hypothetical protein